MRLRRELKGWATFLPPGILVLSLVPHGSPLKSSQVWLPNKNKWKSNNLFHIFLTINSDFSKVYFLKTPFITVPGK